MFKLRCPQYSLALALLVLRSTPVFAQSGQSTVAQLIHIFTGWNGSAADQQTYVEAAKFIDYASMSQRALGQSEWSKLSPSQRDKFVKALRTLVERRYYPRWHRLFAKAVIAYGQEGTVNGDTVLKTSFQINEKSQDLSWCMAKEAGAWKVVSLGVNDKDLLNKLHARLMAKLNKSNFDSLLAWLQNKAPREADDGDKDAGGLSEAKK